RGDKTHDTKEKANGVDSPGVGLKGWAIFGPVQGVPGADFAVASPSNQEPRSPERAIIARKSQAADSVAMPFEDKKLFSGGHIPQDHGLINASRGQGFAVARKCQASDPLRMALESRQFFRLQSFLGIPEHLPESHLAFILLVPRAGGKFRGRLP